MAESRLSAPLFAAAFACRTNPPGRWLQLKQLGLINLWISWRDSRQFTDTNCQAPNTGTHKSRAGNRKSSSQTPEAQEKTRQPKLPRFRLSRTTL